MKTKILKALFLTTIFLSLNNEVNAAYINLEPVYNESHMELYRNINGDYDDLISIQITDKNKKYEGYCLDAGLPIEGDKNIYKYAQNASEYLNEYFRNEKKSDELEKKINRYVYFGYEYNNQKNYKYLMATQKLIWDELYNARYYPETYRKGVYYYTYDESTETENVINITNEINQIKNNISNYLKIPSFCNSNVGELTIGKTNTITDSQNVLSQYKVICNDDLTCKINNNQLEITANSKKTDNSTITLLKEGNTNENIIYKNDEEQGIIVNNGALDSISCEFTINIKKPEPKPEDRGEGCYKNKDTNEYKWFEIDPEISSQNNIYEKVNESKCKPEPEPKPPSNVTVNPPTGNIILFIIITIALSTLTYSIWYYIKNKNIKN